MHIGHLIPFMMMKRFQSFGHLPVILIGGATGTIGDPSGRQSERQLQTLDQVQDNVNALTAQMKKLFVTNSDDQLKMVNNYDWTHTINVIDFLRDYGKNFNVNSMLAKDIVSSRLDTVISFTEFSYKSFSPWNSITCMQKKVFNYKLVDLISGVTLQVV